jgi:hypothetical protein
MALSIVGALVGGFLFSLFGAAAIIKKYALSTEDVCIKLLTAAENDPALARLVRSKSIRAQAPNTTAHPTIKSCASAIRSNLPVGIAVSFEPMFCCH